MKGGFLSGAAGPEIAAFHWPLAIDASAATHACWLTARPRARRNWTRARLFLKLEELKRPKNTRRKPSKQGSCMIVAGGASIYPLPGVFVLGKPVLSSLPKNCAPRKLAAQGASRWYDGFRSTLNTQIDRFRPRARIGCAAETPQAPNGSAKNSQRADAKDAKTSQRSTTQR